MTSRGVQGLFEKRALHQTSKTLEYNLLNLLRYLKVFMPEPFLTCYAYNIRSVQSESGECVS